MGRRAARQDTVDEAGRTAACYAAPVAEPVSPDLAALRRVIEAHGRDAVAFQGLEPGLQAWFDGEDRAVAYADTGGGWVAAGGPSAPAEDRVAVAGRFVAAARAAGRRASFFAVDDPAPWPGFTRVLLGEQPVFVPAEWPAILSQHRKLREQLRRARAKGLRVRRVAPAELAVGTALRTRLDAITRGWLASRSMEPMGFLVTLAPFEYADAHRYYVAERDGRACSFLSLVPVPARAGWLFEDHLREPDAPNGTSESLIDVAMRDLAADGVPFATTGLVPLTGPVSRTMRAVGWLGSALYDFDGLRRFKQRLHPPAWEPVWLQVPDGERIARHVVDGLRAFAGGSLLGFGARTVVRHPGAVALALAVPLMPWAAALAALAAAGHAHLFGFGRGALAAWAAYDAVVAAGLWRASRRPTPRLLGLLAGAATVDAGLSLIHVLQVGLGAGLTAVVRTLAVAAPIIGTVALVWARHRAKALGRPPSR